MKSMEIEFHGRFGMGSCLRSLESVGFVMGGLGMLAGGTGVTEFLHEGPKVGPNIFLSDYHKGFVLSGMPGEDVIMFVLEDSELEVICVWNINLIVMVE
jgi:hypothetical protein